MKGTSEVIPIQLEEGATRVDKETMCKMSDDENEIMKMIDESRDPTSSNKQTNGGRNGDHSKSSSTKSVAPGSSTQTRGGTGGFIENIKQRDSKRSYKETNERGANDAKRARLEDKTDKGFSTKPKPESESKNNSNGNSRSLPSYRSRRSEENNIASINTTPKRHSSSRVSMSPRRYSSFFYESRSNHRNDGASRKNCARNPRNRARQRSESKEAPYRPESPNDGSSEEARDDTSDSQQSEASSSDESHSPRMVANLRCYRCCRTNHDFQDCFAARDVDGDLIDDSVVRCYRCGRSHHMTVDCYAKFDVNHRRL